jgi:predicted dehydrogenase
VDVVDISTPNHLHADQAVAALEAGKHVLLQKPISNSLADADRIVDAWQRSDRRACMYMSSYLNPIVWDLKALVEQGRLGTIQSVHARDAHRGGLNAKPTAWRGSRDLTGGGSFIQLSIHGINLVSFWLGDHIKQVTAYSENRLCPNIGGDDCTVAIVKYAGGAMGTYESGYASDGMLRSVFGTKGNFTLGTWDRELTLQLDEPWEGQFIKYTEPNKPLHLPVTVPAFDDVDNAFNPQRQFLESIASGKKPMFTVLDGRNDLAVVQAVYESAERGETVHVNWRAP